MKEFIKKLIAKLEARKEPVLSKENYMFGNIGLAHVEGFNRGMMCAVAIVNKLAEEYNNGWIPCSERLPEEPKDKLIFKADFEKAILSDDVKEYNVTIKGASLPTTLYYVGDGCWWDEKIEDFCCVIAWQPLPEVYSE